MLAFGSRDNTRPPSLREVALLTRVESYISLMTDV